MKYVLTKKDRSFFSEEDEIGDTYVEESAKDLKRLGFLSEKKYEKVLIKERQRCSCCGVDKGRDTYVLYANSKEDFLKLIKDCFSPSV